MRGASSHSCGSQGDNTGTGRMRRPCCSHAPSLSIRRQRSRTNSPLVPACWQCTWVALVCCLDQDRLIVTASPTYSDTVKLPRPGTRQPAAGGTITAQKPIQGSGRDTHHVPLIDTISTPSLTIHIERISQVVCTHVHHAIRTHRRLHDARLRSSAHRLHTAALFAAEQELTWHWERGSRWERERGAQSLTCDPPSLHLWRLLNNKRTCVPHRNANAHRRTIHSLPAWDASTDCRCPCEPCTSVCALLHA